MIHSTHLPASFSFVDPIIQQARACCNRLTSFFNTWQTNHATIQGHKITYDKRWKQLSDSLQKSPSISWEQNKQDVLKLLQETHSQQPSEVSIYFKRFLEELRPEDALKCLEDILLASLEKDVEPLAAVAAKSADIALFDKILSDSSQGKYAHVKQWAETIAKDLTPPAGQAAAKTSSQDPSSTHVITSFLPNLGRTFLRAFSLFDSARPPESLYDYGALAGLYLHFLSIPYYLFAALSGLIMEPVIVATLALVLLSAAIAALYIYLRYFKKCPTEVMFCQNLSKKRQHEGLKTVIGRNEEYAKVLSLLAMGQPHKGGNVVIVGKPGVGKSVFMEGLADKLPQVQVFKFNNWDITEQDGRFRNPGGRMQMAFDEVKGFEDQTLFCFDELGKEVDKNEGLANYLRMVLPNSKVRFIATMTAEQWQKLKQNNSKDGFEERFVPVFLDPTSSMTTEEILEDRVKHQAADLSISHSAVKKIIELTQSNENNAHEQPRCAKQKLDEMIGQARLFDPQKFETAELTQAREVLNHMLHVSNTQDSPFLDPLSAECQQYMTSIEEQKNKINDLQVESDKVKSALLLLKKHIEAFKRYEKQFKDLAFTIARGKCDALSLKQFAFAQFVAVPALSKKIRALKNALPAEAQKVCLYIDDIQVHHFLAKK